MATLVINLSGGNVHLESLGLVLDPGGRKEFECTETELTILCPEVNIYKMRGRIRVSEDAILVEEEPPALVQAVVVTLEEIPQVTQPIDAATVVETAMTADEQPKAKKSKKSKKDQE